MALDEDLQALLDKWGSEGRLYGYLEEQLAELCTLVCGAGVTVPEIQVKPTWLARGLLGGRQLAGADYEPSEGDRVAIIGLYPSVLTDEAVIRRVLAHELIHHWEHLGAAGASRLSYPDDADKIVSSRFENPGRESRWRAAHSQVFIAKANSVASALDIRLRDLLFS
jgi:hypothetical protein